MTPELETCLNYCDHGEGGGTPYLPTLHGLIVNAISAETSEFKQQVKNFEEYMLKGVAFRDELQGRIKELECQKNALQQVNAKLELDVTAIRTRMERVADERDRLLKEAHALRESKEKAETGSYRVDAGIERFLQRWDFQTKGKDRNDSLMIDTLEDVVATLRTQRRAGGAT